MGRNVMDIEWNAMQVVILLNDYFLYSSDIEWND